MDARWFAEGASNSWRAWLTSGARRIPIDRRRARGADAPLKQILIGGPSGAVDFSSAMARQAIDEAMSELPPEHKQIVKLAYFGGLTNREIAQQLGLSVGGVRRRLRQGLGILSAFVERGGTVGRRAVHSLVLWLYLRRFGDRSHWPAPGQLMQAVSVAAVTVVAAALVVTQQPSPVHLPNAHVAPGVASAGSPGSNGAGAKDIGSPSQPVPAGDAAHRAIVVPSLPLRVPVPAQLPLGLPVHVPALPLPPLPKPVPAVLQLLRA
jgi:hypothetical protein